MRAKYSNGFTLIELMVVVIIVAILAVMAAPSYRDMIERNRLRGAADDVLSFVSNARAEAVKNGLDALIVTTPGSGGVWCVGANGAELPREGARAIDPPTCECATANSCQMQSGEDALVESVVPRGKHPFVTMAEGTTFIFDAKLGTARALDSEAIADPVAIRLTTTNYEVQVDVTPLGQATLCTTGSMAGIAPCP